MQAKSHLRFSFAQGCEDVFWKTLAAGRLPVTLQVNHFRQQPARMAC